jgi:hypothetical protein
MRESKVARHPIHLVTETGPRAVVREGGGCKFCARNPMHLATGTGPQAGGEGGVRDLVSHVSALAFGFPFDRGRRLLAK